LYNKLTGFPLHVSGRQVRGNNKWAWNDKEDEIASQARNDSGVRDDVLEHWIPGLHYVEFILSEVERTQDDRWVDAAMTVLVGMTIKIILKI